MDLSLVETKELVDEIAKRFDTFALFGKRQDNDGAVSWHRSIRGRDVWSFYLPLTSFLAYLRAEYNHCELSESDIDIGGEN